jgi:IclR family transcriptional regulator, pca regulon regulatory protein
MMSSPLMSPRKNQPAKSSDTLFVGSLEKGFRVLEAFTKALVPLGITEIAQLTGLDKSAAQRFSNTLHQLGYLEKDPATRRYMPAVKLLDLSFTYLAQNHLAEIAVPRLIDAGKRFQTTVNLCELVDTDIIYTFRIPHEKASYMATIPGRRIPAYSASSGAVIMANMPEHEAIDIVDRTVMIPMTPYTLNDREAVLARVAEARKQGYSISLQSALMNEISVAAPVLDHNNRAIAAVQIPVYMPAWSEQEAREKIAPLAMETARAISAPLSARHIASGSRKPSVT